MPSHLVIGYPKSFLQKAGLLDSGLGGSEGDIKVGSDSDVSEEPDGDNLSEDQVIADKITPKRTPNRAPTKSPTKIKTPSKPPSTIDLSSVAKGLDQLEDFEDEMRIITVVREAVLVRGFAPSRFQDVLAIQVTLPPGIVLSSVRITIDEEDPIQGVVTVDEDPTLIVGEKRVKKIWRSLNDKLAYDLEALFDKEAKDKFAVEGTTPSHGRLVQSFSWPNGLKSQLNPVDPYALGLREVPTRVGDTLFETKTVKLAADSKLAVPATVLTAFFFVEKPQQVNNSAGNGLSLGDISSEEEDDDSVSPRNRKRSRGHQRNSRGGESGNSVPMDD